MNKPGLVFLIFSVFVENGYSQTNKIDPKLSRIWGPGLKPTIVLPARYFFVEYFDHNNERIFDSSKESPHVLIEGVSKTNRPCRIWSTILDRKDGSYIVRYKLYETCLSLKITVTYKGQHISESPYIFEEKIYSDDCNCPIMNMKTLLNKWECGSVPSLIESQIKTFGEIDWKQLRNKIIKAYDKPQSVSLCHYLVRDNQIRRKCYGKYVGFNMFIDAILLSLSRKVILPDLEFFANLGDWPLSLHNLPEKYPILSWCGSTDSHDIIMPTYDVTESTLENMGRVTLDMLSVQGNTELPWESRIPKLFWRGRDSNKARLDLIKMSRDHLDLFNVSMTNFFFYREEEHIYGPKTEYISFFKFFDYKYQLAVDGTVAPYRMPYLLGGGSLVFKPDSKYFEHFYKDLEPNVHYVPVKADLSDLIEKIQWAQENDDQARKIAQNGWQFANEYLLPKNILCYHLQLFDELSKVITSPIEILEDMELVEQKKLQDCDCSNNIKDEL